MIVAAAWTIAALLAAGAAGLVGWGFVGDRARGRRRCPRCFYPVAAGSLRCSECGHVASSERRLLRTRRRWRAVGAGCVLLAFSAAAGGGGALVPEHGTWGWVPGPALTRLLWVGGGIDDEVVSRVRSARVNRAEARRIAASAMSMLRSTNPSQVDRGLKLLEGLAYNSFVIVSDAPGTLRPMLEELEPRAAVDALLPLLEVGPEMRDRVIALLSHYRDVDRRALIELVSRLAAADPEERDAARKSLGRSWRASETVRRLPHPPGFVLQALNGYYSRGSLLRLEEVESGIERLGAGIAARRDSPDALAAFALGLTEEAQQVTERALGLWLYGHLSGFDERSREMSLQLAYHEDQFLRSTGIQMLAGFEPDAAVLDALESALHSDDPHAMYILPAIDVAAHFGDDAASLQPAFLDRARRFGGGGSSAFVRDFLAIGGDRREMLDALLSWLETSDQLWGLTMRFEWIAELDLQDEDAARRILPFMEEEPQRPRTINDDAPSYAAIAYAALGGDRACATRTILDRMTQRPQTTGTIVGSTAAALSSLCRRGLADPALIADRYLDDPATSLDCLALLRRMGAVARPVADRIAALADHPDPEVAAAAAKALDAIR
jgi:hypothetical protein